jgi:hypothetical protein
MISVIHEGFLIANSYLIEVEQISLHCLEKIFSIIIK